MKGWKLHDSISDLEMEWSAESEPFRELLTEIAVASVRHGPDGTRVYIANCATQFLLGSIDGQLLPVTVNSDELDNSYVCSTYCGVISYPLFELREIKNLLLRVGLSALIRSVAPLLRRAQINRVVCVNNWMLSTNLYPAWDGTGLAEIRDDLISRYPKHAIMFRSLNAANHGAVLDTAEQNGFLLVPSRQVYIADDSEVVLKKHRNVRYDRRLLDRSVYTVCRHDELTSKDDERIKQLYDWLYLEKYSRLNPQFTVQLIRRWRESGALLFVGLRSPSGSLDGINGFFHRARVMTTPLVGYDTSLPRSVGLYRMLMALTFQEAFRCQAILNLSSGAAELKRLRGGKPYLEYSAVYCQHLPNFNRRAWQALAGLLTQVGGRVLKKLEL